MSEAIILLSRELPPALQQALGALGRLRVHADATAEALVDARIYCATALDPVAADLIESLPDSLGLIANIGVGTDNIDLEAASRKGIQVSNTPVVTEDTADLAWALLLAACRRLTASEVLLRSGGWSGQLAPETLGLRVHGKTLGIIGLGEIGQAVARRAAGFRMKVIYHGPNRKPEAEAELGAEYRDRLEDLLSEADIVSLHCPLSAATRHLLGKAAFLAMKPSAVLINTGRGPVVDEAALIEALASGRLGAAGLDVFEFEPRVSSALLDFPNVTLLPHIGSATGDCRQDMALRAVNNIRSFLETGQAVDRVA